MGLFSDLFGGSKEKKALNAAFEKIQRLIEDEEYQLELLPPEMADQLKSRPPSDTVPNATGQFGYSETNPIPVNGPLGELAYLSRLETLSGERILFHRIGAIDRIDVFEAVTLSGSQWFILFVDFYFPKRSKLVPESFRFTKQPSQFSGFNRFCRDFPFDFADMKATQRESGLSMAYMPLSKIEYALVNRKQFQRPLAHAAKLDLLRPRITSSLDQVGT